MWKSNARDRQVTVREGLETLRDDIAKAIAKARGNRVHAIEISRACIAAGDAVAQRHACTAPL
jgi:hypothetical protein